MECDYCVLLANSGVLWIVFLILYLHTNYSQLVFSLPQNSRLEDQRSPDPFLERSQTLPGEDFLNLLLQLQSMRMEDQRSPFPNPFV